MNYEQKYPYFTVTRVTSGQLVKLTNKKFNDFYEALKEIDIQKNYQIIKEEEIEL